ncbi:MAG: hypothetical protein H7A25_02900 [Leptospiraceae bacterium]|nr:hypothetical protein [Leptospiraceae bacterium]MCP5498827.1 hypothetical protein [Leptospiraceae bacterium]
MKTLYTKILYISELVNTHILKNILRFFDAFGSGSYNSTNGNRKNKGVDFICIPGQEVFSPISGKVVSKFYTMIIGDMVATCHCEGKIEYKNIQNNKTMTNDTDYLIVQKKDKIIIIYPTDLQKANITFSQFLLMPGSHRKLFFHLL